MSQDSFSDPLGRWLRVSQGNKVMEPLDSHDQQARSGLFSLWLDRISRMRAEIRLRTGPTPSLPYPIDQSQWSKARLKDGTRASTSWWEEPLSHSAKGVEVDTRKEGKLRKSLQYMYYRDISYRLLFFKTLQTDLTKYLCQRLCWDKGEKECGNYKNLVTWPRQYLHSISEYCLNLTHMLNQSLFGRKWRSQWVFWI